MTIEKWIDKHYKPSRLNRTPNTRQRIIEDRENDIELYGWTVIGCHDARTGELEIYRSAK